MFFPTESAAFLTISSYDVIEIFLIYKIQKSSEYKSL